MTSVNDKCKTVTTPIVDYIRTFERNSCPSQFQKYAFTNQGKTIVVYNEDRVQALSTGDMNELLRSYYKATNGFSKDSRFTLLLAELCNSIPGACDSTLKDLCEDQDLVSNTSQNLCSCFLTDDVCKGGCDSSSTVKPHLRLNRLDVCNRPLCSVSGVTVNRLGTTTGTVSINSVCPQCTEDSPCDCVFSSSSSLASALYRSSNKSSVCSTRSCEEGDCGYVDFGTIGQSYTLLYIILAVFAVIIVGLFLVYIMI